MGRPTTDAPQAELSGVPYQEGGQPMAVPRPMTTQPGSAANPNPDLEDPESARLLNNNQSFLNNPSLRHANCPHCAASSPNHPAHCSCPAQLVEPVTSPAYGRCTYLYYRWVNPWIRWIIIAVPLVYFYAVLLNIVTYRNANLGEQTLHWQQIPDLTLPREDNRGVYLVLEDFFHERIPRAPYNSPEYTSWKQYCDFCAFFFNVLVALICWIRWDMLRFAELFGCHMTLYALMYLTKIVTLYPAPLYTEGCLKPDHRTIGMWVFREVLTTDFCGDQMFSGHTNNTFVPLIILTRIIYDIVGWDLRFRMMPDDYHDLEYNVYYPVVDTAPALHGTWTDNNEDVWFHPRYSYSVRANWRAKSCCHYFVWALVTFWRILKWFILGIFVYALLKIRQHYFADIMVSMIIIAFMTSNTRYVQGMVRWMYRPNYWNYKRTGLFALVKLRPPLTREQANWEDRLAKLGRGGIF